MPYSTAGLNAGANGVVAAGNFISAHSADPGATGASEVAGTTRQASTFATASNGARVGSQITMPMPAGSSVAHWGLWSAASGGTFLGSWPLSAPESFGSAGDWKHTPTVTAAN